MKKYIIKLNGKVYEVEMEEVTGEAAGEVAATAAEPLKPEQTQSVPVAAPQSAPPVSGGEIVEAPMPGTIVGVGVKVGDQIKKGQVLVVLEAMKMENEIVSPKDGRVTAVNVSKGQAVNPGEALVQIV
jgi:glutaconyl-CoA/methylmalonyl-CoA decarboxylase subunit gamma